MKEITGNIWDYHKDSNWICVTTNGFVKKNGEAVMGRGVALQAANRFPSLPLKLGDVLSTVGNLVHPFTEFRLITFPVKHAWYDEADLKLIQISVMGLKAAADILGAKNVYLPRPGCGNGKLKWKDVAPIVRELDDRFTVVELP